MPETSSFYQHFHIKRLSRFMTKIKEKSYFHLGRRNTLLLETKSERIANEIIESSSSKSDEQPVSKPIIIEYPVITTTLPSSLPPPPRYRHAHKSPIQTRSSFIATEAKPCLCRSNTLGHPTTPHHSSHSSSSSSSSGSSASSLETPDQLTSPMSMTTTTATRTRIITIDSFEFQDDDGVDQLSLLPLTSSSKQCKYIPENSCECYNDNSHVSTPLHKETQTGYIPPIISRTPSLINFPDSPSSSILGM